MLLSFILKVTQLWTTVARTSFKRRSKQLKVNCFFSGMSILSKNSDEANNMPTQWIVLISRRNYLWKSYLPQANTYAFCYCSITCFSVQAVMYWWSNCSYVEAEKWTDLSSMSLSTLKTWLQLLFQMKYLHLMPCTDSSMCKLCGNVAVMFYNHRAPTCIDFAWACTQTQGGSLALSYWDLALTVCFQSLFPEWEQESNVHSVS